MAASYAASSKGLLLWGGLDENDKPFLEPAFVVTALPSLPHTEGPYQVAGEDERGNNLFSLPFGRPEYGRDAKGGAFAFIVPVQPDWAGRLARIALSGPEGVSILDGQDDPSAALLLDRDTVDVRGILRDAPEAAAGKRPASPLIPPEWGQDLTQVTLARMAWGACLPGAKAPSPSACRQASVGAYRPNPLIWSVLTMILKGFWKGVIESERWEGR